MIFQAALNLLGLVHLYLLILLQRFLCKVLEASKLESFSFPLAKKN